MYISTVCLYSPSPKDNYLVKNLTFVNVLALSQNISMFVNIFIVRSLSMQHLYYLFCFLESTKEFAYIKLFCVCFFRRSLVFLCCIDYNYMKNNFSILLKYISVENSAKALFLLPVAD